MKKINEHIATMCEELGWHVHEDDSDGSVELTTYAPSGGQFIATVDGGEDFIKNVREYSNRFDPEEYAAETIKGCGTDGFPGIRTVLNDADAVDDSLRNLADELERLETEVEVKVSFENAGEGICDDYNPDNPNDVPLLRLYICGVGKINKDIMEGFPGGSTCTQFPVGTPEDVLTAATEYILKVVAASTPEHIYTGDIDETILSSLCDELSWMGPDNMDPFGLNNVRFNSLKDLRYATKRLNKEENMKLEGVSGFKEVVHILSEFDRGTGDIDDVIDWYEDGSVYDEDDDKTSYDMDSVETDADIELSEEQKDSALRALKVWDSDDMATARTAVLVSIMEDMKWDTVSIESIAVLAVRMLSMSLSDARFTVYDFADAVTYMPKQVSIIKLLQLDDEELENVLCRIAQYKRDSYCDNLDQQDETTLDLDIYEDED